MDQLVSKIRFWDNKSSPSSTPTDTREPSIPHVSCSDETVDYKSYHLCAYDPILSVLLCVGDNAPVVVLGHERRRVTLPVRKGACWLDCHIFAGTTSFLLLSSESLLLVDYAQRSPSSGLFTRGTGVSSFSCLHVPQGMTMGTLGCRDGSVVYWKLKREGSSSKLTWAALTTNILGFCKPFIPTKSSTNATVGRIYAIDSFPTNPNALVAVLAGVPGVCKWYMDENRLSAFFTSSKANTKAELAACRVTPGGAYIVATSMDISAIFIWSENGKKRRDRSVELLWTVESGGILRNLHNTKGGHSTSVSAHSASKDNVNGSSDNEDAAPSNIDIIADDWDTCGIHIARSTTLDSHAHSDKKSEMHFLLYAAGELAELVLDIDGKKVLQREDVLAHAVSMHVPSTNLTDAKASLPLHRVFPCVRSNYWVSSWMKSDLDTLLLTSRDGAPLLVQRNRAHRAVDAVVELSDLPVGPPWGEGSLLIAPNSSPPVWFHTAGKDLWASILHSTTLAASAEGPEAVCLTGNNPIVLISPPCGTRAAACLAPVTNECVPISPDALRVWMCDEEKNASASSPSTTVVLLERAVPAPPERSQVILRVTTDEQTVTVWMVHLISNLRTERLVTISRTLLFPEGGDTGPCVARAATFVDCRLERVKGPNDTQVQFFHGGKSVLLQLCDASLLLVNLSGIGNDSVGDSCNENAPFPVMVRYPIGLFPAGTSVNSFEVAWVSPTVNRTKGYENVEATDTSTLALFCTLSEQSGVIVWDMRRMRLLAYLPRRDKDWRWDTVAITRSLTNNMPEYGSNGGELILTIGPGATPGSKGSLCLRDLIGRRLFSIQLAYACGGRDDWCAAGAETEWYSLGPTSAKAIGFGVKIVNGAVFLVVASGVEHNMGNAMIPMAQVERAEVDGEWSFPPFDSNPRGEQAFTTVVFHNETEVGFYNASTLVFGKSEGKIPMALCRCEKGRGVECVSLCEPLRAALVLTRDVNKWRWLSLMHLESAAHLTAPLAMIHFTEEERIDIHIATIEEDRLHVYLLGEKALGHVSFYRSENSTTTVTRNDDSANIQNRESPGDGERYDGPPMLNRNPFSRENCASVPPSFRLYKRYLPAPPTTKQEQGFLKRLMTLPWEEIAVKIEDEVMRAERAESFEDFQQRIVAPSVTKTVSKGQAEPAVPQERRSTEQEKRELLRGTRYNELKETAARENVSLNEARRIMNENQMRLEERGERLTQIESKSRELAEQAATFQDLARQLKEKQRDKWF